MNWPLDPAKDETAVVTRWNQGLVVDLYDEFDTVDFQIACHPREKEILEEGCDVRGYVEWQCLDDAVPSPNPSPVPDLPALISAHVIAGPEPEESLIRDVIQSSAYATPLYAEPPAIAAWSCKACTHWSAFKGFKMRKLFNDTSRNVLFYMGTETLPNGTEQVVIAFRGSKEDDPNDKCYTHKCLFGLIGHNWSANLSAFPTNQSWNGVDVDVHSGFFDNQQGAWRDTGAGPFLTELLGELAEAQRAAGVASPKLTIRVVGHSMGGAMATILASRLKWDQTLPAGIDARALTVKLHTFGSPYVGNEFFVREASKYIDEVIRVTHRLDPVSAAGFAKLDPPFDMPDSGHGFVHIGTEWYLPTQQNHLYGFGAGKAAHQVDIVVCSDEMDPKCHRKTCGQLVECIAIGAFNAVLAPKDLKETYFRIYDHTTYFAFVDSIQNTEQMRLEVS